MKLIQGQKVNTYRTKIPVSVRQAHFLEQNITTSTWFLKTTQVW